MAQIGLKSSHDIFRELVHIAAAVAKYFLKQICRFRKGQKQNCIWAEYFPHLPLGWCRHFDVAVFLLFSFHQFTAQFTFVVTSGTSTRSVAVVFQGWVFNIT